MTGSTTQVPDLLRRFVPTSFSATSVFHGLQVQWHTNDPDLAAALKKAEPAAPSENLHRVNVTVVRDEDAPFEEAEITVISASLLRVISAGTGTMLVVDLERREVFGFVGESVSADRLLHELLPIAANFLAETVRT